MMNQLILKIKTKMNQKKKKVRIVILLKVGNAFMDMSENILFNGLN